MVCDATAVYKATSSASVRLLERSVSCVEEALVRETRRRDTSFLEIEQRSHAGKMKLATGGDVGDSLVSAWVQGISISLQS